MRGYSLFNFPAFDAETARLRALGHTVFSPAERDRQDGFNPVTSSAKTIDFYMAIDLPEVCKADAIVVLPGWEKSQGSNIEVAVGIEVGKKILHAGTLAPVEGQEMPFIRKITPEKGTAAEVCLPGTASEMERMIRQALPDKVFKDEAKVRKFESGATRNLSHDKPDYDGFLSPHMIEAFGQYMHKHRHQADGTLRDSDNWQKGIPLKEYIKSNWRHFIHLWRLSRGLRAWDEKGNEVFVPDTCAAIWFNTQGYFHEWAKANDFDKPPKS